MDWTPITEKEPEKDGWYWFTTKDGMVKLEVIHNGNFFNNSGILNFESCIAWQLIEKPDPYEPPMTEAEAVALISKIPFHNDSNIEKCLSLSYKALMKQIPKHVTFGAGVLICPICGVDARAKDRYCFWCGQALEWEDK